jgi:hypothetical protein
MRRALLRAATRVLRLQRCKRESAPAIGRTGAPLVLRVAEPELAREPRTPGAERQGSSAQARRLHELRSEFRFTSLAKKIRMTLAVIPQMRLRKHGSLPSTSRTRSRAVVFLTVPSRTLSSAGRTPCATSPASFVRSRTHAKVAGARIFPALTFGSTSAALTRSSPSGSRMRRRRSGGMRSSTSGLWRP